jgi:hypothetical protein
LDFKEDQLAIEAYVRMRCGWRDDDEISHEEFVTYAFEYMEENPFVEEGMVCANCVFYEGGQGCEIVTGLIDPMALCKFWIIPEDLLTSVSKHRAGKGCGIRRIRFYILPGIKRLAK